MGGLRRGVRLDQVPGDLLIAAHRQLPGGVVVLVWDNFNVHRRAGLRAFAYAQARLRVFRLPLTPEPGWPWNQVKYQETS